MSVPGDGAPETGAPPNGESGPDARAGGERLEPVTDPAGHPDLATLAGISGRTARPADEPGTSSDSPFGPEVTRALRQHVQSCAHCTAQADRIAAVRGQLAALPRPTMPVAVADRLTAALRAEAAAGTAGATGLTSTAGTSGAAGATPAPGGTGSDSAAVHSLDAARVRRAKRVRWLSGAAAAAAIIAVGTVALVVPHGRHTTTAGSGARPTVSSTSSRSPGTGLPSAVASGLFGSPKSGPNPYGPARTGIGLGKLRSLSPSTLGAAVPAIVREAPVSPTGPISIDSRAGELSQPSLRRACSTALVGAGRNPIAVERVRFRDDPAYVLIYRTGGRYDVYVAGASCGTHGGVALFHTSVPA